MLVYRPHYTFPHARWLVSPTSLWRLRPGQTSLEKSGVMMLSSHSFRFFGLFFIRKGGFIRGFPPVQLGFCRRRGTYRCFPVLSFYSPPSSIIRFRHSNLNCDFSSPPFTSTVPTGRCSHGGPDRSPPEAFQPDLGRQNLSARQL